MVCGFEKSGKTRYWFLVPGYWIKALEIKTSVRFWQVGKAKKA
ncbi:MAG: hypothetical protein PVG39_17690 [Desulfobacteraceae bacterium]|jgi:hypothetical protein